MPWGGSGYYYEFSLGYSAPYGTDITRCYTSTTGDNFSWFAGSCWPYLDVGYDGYSVFKVLR